MTENENISEIIMSKMFDEHIQVNIDYEWRKVVCLDDIGSILRRELKKLNEEIQQYRSIGTVSECREAMEKQRAKKVEKEKEPYKSPWGGKDIDVYDVCPNCGTNIGIKPYPHCPYCGQCLDWE